MTAPQTDSFEEFMKKEFGENSFWFEGWNRSDLKTLYKAGQKDAEKKIEEADVYEANKEIELLKEDTEELKRGTIIGLNLHAEELKRSSELRKKIEKLKLENTELKWDGRFDIAEKKIEALVKALEFYGDKKNWCDNDYYTTTINSGDWTSHGPVNAIGGKRARKALADIKELK